MNITNIVEFKNKLILVAAASFAVLGLAVSTQTVAAATGGTQSTASYSTATVNSTTVAGVVKNGAGNRIGNATVKLSRNGNVVRTTTTAADGTFSITDAPQGENYKIIVSKQGFVTYRSFTFPISGGGTIFFEIVLQRV